MLLAYSHVVDLSHSIHPGIPLWRGDPPVEFERIASLQKDGYSLRRFSIGEHSATHMNAPKGFLEAGIGIDAYPPESLVLPAVVLEFRQQALENPDYALSIGDILDWEKQHGRISAGSLVILYTGWQEKWDDPQAFINLDSLGRPRFPGFDGETARFLMEERRIAGVGTDTHGVDPGTDDRYTANSHILRRRGIVLECLDNLHRLPPTGATLIIGILRLVGGTGSPAAVTALVP